MSDRFLTRKKTQEKRKKQKCRVFQLKIDRSHLSKKIIDHLYCLFREAKWFYNYAVSLKHINDVDTTLKSVLVKVKEEYENREFKVLKSHMKQGIKTRAFTSIKVLSIKKKQGKRVGYLKFKSSINSIPLPEFYKDFDLDKEKLRIRISGIKQWLRVNGMDQLLPEYEVANATLVKKCNDFYLHVTTFENEKPNDILDQSIGIDFGCETQLTLSNGIKIKFQVPVSDQLKRLDRKIDKKVNGKIGKHRGSKNRRRLQTRRRKLYERLTNKKKDIRNKVVSAIVSNYKVVCFQDESIHAWSMSNHGKKIQSTGIGGIIRDLKNKSHTPIEVDKWYPSTQTCPECGVKNKLSQSDRVYNCGCGYQEDRDVKAAIMIEREGLKSITVPTEYRDQVVSSENDKKLGEKRPSTIFDVLMKVNGIDVSKDVSLSQEALKVILL